MQRMLWFPLYIDHFMASKRVLHMTIGEQGAYLRLLMFAWSDPICSLPKSLVELMRMALWTPNTEGNFQHVRDCFTTHPENKKRIYNARLYDEWKKVEGLREKRREASQARWHKQQEIPSAPQPTKKPIKREQSGLSSVGQEVSKIADKYFPPVS